MRDYRLFSRFKKITKDWEIGVIVDFQFALGAIVYKSTIVPGFFLQLGLGIFEVELSIQKELKWEKVSD